MSKEEKDIKSEWIEVVFKQKKDNKNTLIVEVDRSLYEQADENIRRALIQTSFLLQDFYLVAPDKPNEKVYLSPREDGRHENHKLVSAEVTTPIDIELGIQKLGSRLYAEIRVHHLNGSNHTQISKFRQVHPNCNLH